MLTASGYVVNLCPPESFPLRNTAETIFNRLESHGLTWKVYCDPPAHLSFTALIHAARLKDRFATHFVTTGQFLQDAANGELPAYSFIEPALLHGHNDMHPPENALFPALPWTGPPPSSAARRCWRRSTTPCAPRPHRRGRTSTTPCS